MKFALDEIISTLAESGVPADKVKLVAQALEELGAENKADRDHAKVPKSKQQFVIILANADGSVTTKDLTGWVVQIPEGDDTATTLDRIKSAAKDQNATMPKFKKKPLKNLGDALQNLKRRFAKSAKVLIKTPNSVVVLKTDNVL